MFFNSIMPPRGRFKSATRKVIENNLSDVIRVKKPVVEIKIEEEKESQYHETIDAVSDIVSNVSLTVTEAAGNQTNNMLQFYSDSFIMNANNVVQLISYVGEDTVSGSGFLIVYPEEYIVSSLSLNVYKFPTIFPK